MTPRNFGFQGKRDDDDAVTFSELVAGICFGLLLVFAIGSCFATWVTP